MRVETFLGIIFGIFLLTLVYTVNKLIDDSNSMIGKMNASFSKERIHLMDRIHTLENENMKLKNMIGGGYATN